MLFVNRAIKHVARAREIFCPRHMIRNNEKRKEKRMSKRASKERGKKKERWSFVYCDRSDR